MNERLKYPIVITGICLVAAAGLAVTYALTRDRIKLSKRGELDSGLAFVLPDAAMPPKEDPLPDGRTVFIGFSRSKPDEIVGYAATGTARGYSSPIVVLVGLQPDMRITAIRILSQSETPGLGERTREVRATKSIWRAIADALRGTPSPSEQPIPDFQRQFAGKTSSDLVLTTDAAKNPAQIVQLTGATITSRAVVEAVKNAVTTVQEKLKRDGEQGPARTTAPAGVQRPGTSPPPAATTVE